MRAKRTLPAAKRKQTPPRGPMLRFLAIFVALIGIYYTLTLSPWVDANGLLPVMKASAHGTSVLLNLIGFKTIAEGVVVRGPAYAVAVRRGCDPIEPIALFAAAVMAFPAPWRQRLAGLLLVSVFLFGLNLVRVVSLYLLGVHQSELLESFHLVWWPALFIACSLLLWTVWLRWVLRSRSGSESTDTAKPQRRRTPFSQGAG